MILSSHLRKKCGKFTKIPKRLYSLCNSKKDKEEAIQSITIEDLDTLANERLEDAKVLYSNNRFWGAIYICGYAVEFGLKKKICKTINRNEYPDIRDLKTHKLDTLLILSGTEKLIISEYSAEWSIVRKWDPEQRYILAPVNQEGAKSMIDATNTILGLL